MDGWIKSALDGAIRNAQDALSAVTRDFRVKLLGAWNQLLLDCLGGLLLVGGFWLGRHW
jgi:hypothetical protein